MYVVQIFDKNVHQKIMLKAKWQMEQQLKI